MRYVATCVFLATLGVGLATAARADEVPDLYRQSYALEARGDYYGAIRLMNEVGSRGGGGGREPSKTGAPCAAAEECAPPTCLLPRAMGRRAPPAGTTGLCSVPCDTMACPQGATCEPMGPGRFCFVECLAPEACPRGTVCDLQRRVCWPDCRAGWPCPSMAPCGPDGFCAGERGGRG